MQGWTTMRHRSFYVKKYLRSYHFYIQESVTLIYLLNRKHGSKDVNKAAMGPGNNGLTEGHLVIQN